MASSNYDVLETKQIELAYKVYGLIRFEGDSRVQLPSSIRDVVVAPDSKSDDIKIISPFFEVKELNDKKAFYLRYTQGGYVHPRACEEDRFQKMAYPVHTNYENVYGNNLRTDDLSEIIPLLRCTGCGNSRRLGYMSCCGNWRCGDCYIKDVKEFLIIRVAFRAFDSQCNKQGLINCRVDRTAHFLEGVANQRQHNHSMCCKSFGVYVAERDATIHQIDIEKCFPAPYIYHSKLATQLKAIITTGSPTLDLVDGRDTTAMEVLNNRTDFYTEIDRVLHSQQLDFEGDIPRLHIHLIGLGTVYDLQRRERERSTVDPSFGLLGVYRSQVSVVEIIDPVAPVQAPVDDVEAQYAEMLSVLERRSTIGTEREPEKCISFGTLKRSEQHHIILPLEPDVKSKCLPEYCVRRSYNGLSEKEDLENEWLLSLYRDGCDRADLKYVESSRSGSYSRQGDCNICCEEEVTVCHALCCGFSLCLDCLTTKIRRGGEISRGCVGCRTTFYVDPRTLTVLPKERKNAMRGGIFYLPGLFEHRNGTQVKRRRRLSPSNQ